MAPLLEEGSGLVAGSGFHLGYSPERIDPGNPRWGLANTPKVVSGIDAASLVAVQGFYDRIVVTTVAVSGCKEAELTKLLENTFRYVNIASGPHLQAQHQRRPGVALPGGGRSPAQLGAEVRVVDPHVVEGRVDARMVFAELSVEELAGADAVVMLVDHDDFDLALVASHAQLRARHPPLPVGRAGGAPVASNENRLRAGRLCPIWAPPAPRSTYRPVAHRGFTLMLGSSAARAAMSSGSPVGITPPPARMAVATTMASAR